MIEHIQRQRNNEAIRQGDQTAHMIFYITAALGADVGKYEDLNVFRKIYEEDSKTSSRPSPIAHISQRAAEGLVQAVERGLLPNEVWLRIAPLWDNITETAGSVNGNLRRNNDNSRRGSTQRST